MDDKIAIYGSITASDSRAKQREAEQREAEQREQREQQLDASITTEADPYQAAWDTYIRVTIRSHRVYKRSKQTRQDLINHQKITEKAYYNYVKTTKALDVAKAKQEANREVNDT